MLTADRALWQDDRATRKVMGGVDVEGAALTVVVAIRNNVRVAVETVSRWENDRTAIDRPALHALGELAVDGGEGRTTAADALRAMAGPHGRRPKRVILAMG